MKLFQKLFHLSESVASLQDYLNTNLQEVYDFENSCFSSIELERLEIEDYILFKVNVLSVLDFTNSQSRAFVILLFEICERLSLGCTIRLETIIQENNLELGARLSASRLYLLRITQPSDFINRFELICENLQKAIDEEEDNNRKVLSSFFNYIAKVVLDTSFPFFNQLIVKIKSSYELKRFSFLESNFISDFLLLDFVSLDQTHKKIQLIIESIFERDLQSEVKNKVGVNVFQIESDTLYANDIHLAPKSFSAIRKINVRRYMPVGSKSIFDSLVHGVAILQNENQLFAYMHSLGDMHFHKLYSAFDFLPPKFFDEPIDIIDWGCGQGMATMVYLDFLHQKHQKQTIGTIILIEPSEIALKRGGLHTYKYTGVNNLLGINKDLDSLSSEDFAYKQSQTKLHLFSNILDIEAISLGHLLDITSKNFTGSNYFVCVSPHIHERRNGRVNAFVNFFSTLAQFKILGSIDNKKYEWQKDWTRLIRVFKVNL